MKQSSLSFLRAVWFTTEPRAAFSQSETVSQSTLGKCQVSDSGATEEILEFKQNLATFWLEKYLRISKIYIYIYLPEFPSI